MAAAMAAVEGFFTSWVWGVPAAPVHVLELAYQPQLAVFQHQGLYR